MFSVNVAMRGKTIQSSTPSMGTEVGCPRTAPVCKQRLRPIPGGGSTCWSHTESQPWPSPTERTAVLRGSTELRSALGTPWKTTATATQGTSWLYGVMSMVSSEMSFCVFSLIYYFKLVCLSKMTTPMRNGDAFKSHHNWDKEIESCPSVFKYIQIINVFYMQIVALLTILNRCTVISSIPAGGASTFQCNGMEGRYVNIFSRGYRQHLTLCEVEVNAVPVPVGMESELANITKQNISEIT